MSSKHEVLSPSYENEGKIKEFIISDSARGEIERIQREQFNNEDIVLLLADLHSLGTAWSIEIHKKERIENNGHFALLLEKQDLIPWDVYVDCQALQEGYLPEHILIDYTQDFSKKRWGFQLKNPLFEK